MKNLLLPVAVFACGALSVAAALSDHDGLALVFILSGAVWSTIIRAKLDESK